MLPKVYAVCRVNTVGAYTPISCLHTSPCLHFPTGQTQSLYILTKYHNQRFEFIFTAAADSSSQLFAAVQGVQRAYELSRLYRDLKLRGELGAAAGTEGWVNEGGWWLRHRPHCCAEATSWGGAS